MKVTRLSSVAAYSGVFFVVVFVLVAVLPRAAFAQAEAFHKERVTYNSGDLTVVGFTSREVKRVVEDLSRPPRMNPEHADQKGIPQRLADKTGHQITLTIANR
jgi:hypothetical protein